MKKSVLLASILSKLPDEMQKELVGEITELVKSKTGGLEFGLTAKDVLEGVELGEIKTPEQMQEEIKLSAFREAIRGNKPGAGGNVIEV